MSHRLYCIVVVQDKRNHEASDSSGHTLAPSTFRQEEMEPGVGYTKSALHLFHMSRTTSGNMSDLN